MNALDGSNRLRAVRRARRAAITIRSIETQQNKRLVPMTKERRNEQLRKIARELPEPYRSELSTLRDKIDADYYTRFSPPPPPPKAPPVTVQEQDADAFWHAVWPLALVILTIVGTELLFGWI